MRVLLTILLSIYLIAPTFAADIFSFTDTWTDGGDNTTISCDTTDTSSHASSDVIRMLVDSSNVFTVSKTGLGYFADSLGVGIEAPTSSIQVPLENDSATPTISFSDGDTGLYERSDDSLAIAIGAALKINITATSTRFAFAGNDAMIMHEIASATNPVYSFSSDNDTGIGSAGADILSLISGGVEAVNVDDSQNFGVGTSTFDGSAEGVVAIANGVAPAAGTAGQCYMFAVDISTSSELRVMDEAGNITTISPHMDADLLQTEFDIDVNADDPMPRIEMTTNVFIGCIQITYTDPITHVAQTTHKFLGDSEMVDWDENQLVYKNARDLEIAEWELRKAASEDEILAYPALKAERDREQAAWEVLRQAAADETAAWKADKAADPANFTDPPPAEFKIKQPPSLLAPTQFTEIRPADFVVKPELPYITRGKAIRARLK